MLLRKRNNYMCTDLIVDDEMIERKGIRMLLSWMNIRENILEASNGEEALEVFDKEKIDVLLTDINMPFMDGIELLSRIHEEYPGTETVIFSVSPEKAKLGIIRLACIRIPPAQPTTASRSSSESKLIIVRE